MCFKIDKLEKKLTQTNRQPDTKKKNKKNKKNKKIKKKSK